MSKKIEFLQSSGQRDCPQIEWSKFETRVDAYQKQFFGAEGALGPILSKNLSGNINHAHFINILIGYLIFSSQSERSKSRYRNFTLEMLFMWLSADGISNIPLPGNNSDCMAQLASDIIEASCLNPVISY